MDLKQLQYFVTVVEEGNISTAAKKLHMSQPPLSTQIKLLEEEFGCILFERGARQIKLTDAGKSLYKHAIKLLELSRITKEEVTNSRVANGGTIRIGVVSSVICSFLASWLEEFIKIYPRVSFEIYEANTYELLEKLKANLIHIAVVRRPFVEDSLTVEMLYDEGLVAIGDKALFGDSKETITFEELSQKPLIMYRRWEDILQKEFSDRKLDMNCFCINEDARTTVYLAEQGLGIGIVPASTKDLVRNRNTSIKRISQCKINSKVELVYDTSTYMPECSKKFIQHLKSCFLISKV